VGQKFNVVRLEEVGEEEWDEKEMLDAAVADVVVDKLDVFEGTWKQWNYDRIIRRAHVPQLRTHKSWAC
jgi:hypothetical protein